MSGPRFVLYCHDAVGLGHVRRTITLANELVRAEPAANVLIATGCQSLELFAIAPRVDVLRLPSIRKDVDGGYGARQLEVTREQIISLRGAVLAAAVASFRPDVLLVDKHAAGAGGELAATVARMKAQRGRLVLGFRDILDAPEVVRREWARPSFRQTMSVYDAILVYGDRRVTNHEAAYGLRPYADPPVTYCGYVVSRSNEPTPAALARVRSGPRVLATAGGGEDGRQLLCAAMAAATGADWDVHVVLGPMADGEGIRELERQAELAGATLHRQVPHLGDHFREFDALVTMAGYNTLVEAAASAVPTVCVPRVYPRTEQQIRSRAFSRLGLVDAVDPSELTPAYLRGRLELALSGGKNAGPRAVMPIDLNGAQNAARALSQLASAPVLSATGTGGPR